LIMLGVPAIGFGYNAAVQAMLDVEVATIAGKPVAAADAVRHELQVDRHVKDAKDLQAFQDAAPRKDIPLGAAPGSGHLAATVMWHPFAQIENVGCRGMLMSASGRQMIASSSKTHTWSSFLAWPINQHAM